MSNSISKLPTGLDLNSDEHVSKSSSLIFSNLLGAQSVHVDLLNIVQQVAAGLPRMIDGAASRENEFLQNATKASFVILHKNAPLKELGEVFVTGHAIFLHEDIFLQKINQTGEIQEDTSQAIAWLKEGALRCFEENLRLAGFDSVFSTSSDIKNSWPFIEQERARYALLNSNTSGVSEDFLNTFVPLNTQEADFFRYMSAVQKSDDILALEWKKVREIPFQDIDLTQPSFGYANQSWARFLNFSLKNQTVFEMKKWSNNDFLAQKMVEGAEQEEKEYENTRNLMEACLLSAQNSPITEDETLNLFPLIQSFVSRARASEGDVENLKFLVGCVMSLPFSPTIAFEGAFGNNWRSKMNEKWRMDLLLENNQKGADALYALRVYSETLFDSAPPELLDLRHKSEQTMRVLLKDPEVGLHENHWVAFASIAPHISKDVFLLQENNFNAQEILNAFIKNIDSWMEEESASDIADFLVNFVRQNAPSILFKKSSREEDSLLPVVWWDVLIAAEDIPELAVLVDEGLKTKILRCLWRTILFERAKGCQALLVWRKNLWRRWAMTVSLWPHPPARARLFMSFFWSKTPAISKKALAWGKKTILSAQSLENKTLDVFPSSVVC